MKNTKDDFSKKYERISIDPTTTLGEWEEILSIWYFFEIFRIQNFSKFRNIRKKFENFRKNIFFEKFGNNSFAFIQRLLLKKKILIILNLLIHKNIKIKMITILI